MSFNLEVRSMYSFKEIGYYQRNKKKRKYPMLCATIEPILQPFPKFVLLMAWLANVFHIADHNACPFCFCIHPSPRQSKLQWRISDQIHYLQSEQRSILKNYIFKQIYLTHYKVLPPRIIVDLRGIATEEYCSR